MKKSNKNQEANPQQALVDELVGIKRLLLLLLLKGGATQNELGKALAMNQATVSRQYGMGKVKPFGVEIISGGDSDN
jgi:hypothetical protein